MSRCTIESECRYAIADVRWPISKRAWGSENLEAAAILSNKSPPRNINKVQVVGVKPCIIEDNNFSIVNDEMIHYR